MIDLNRLYNMDCMVLMREIPDKFFELAIVDPPYGIRADDNPLFGVKTQKAGSLRKAYDKKDWDNSTPPPEYFTELFRVSKNQVIWGANYFGLKGGMLFWHKNQTNYSCSSGEIAYLSMMIGVHYVDILWHGAYQQDMKNKEHRIHPTQKPVALYKWLLTNYAKPGDKILDTHAGSCSSVIAFIDGGFDWVACELDKDYYEAAMKRIQNHVKQTDLFNERKQEFIQPTLL